MKRIFLEKTYGQTAKRQHANVNDEAKATHQRTHAQRPAGTTTSCPPPAPIRPPHRSPHPMSVVDPSTAPATAADPDGPDSVRLTWNTWPRSKVEASRCVVPLAATISPTRVRDPSSPVLCILYVQYCVLLRGR